MSASAIYYIDSPLGKLLARFENELLEKLEFSEPLGKNTSSIPVYVSIIEKQVKSYFEGKIQDFNIPYNLKGTDFQKTVWNKLLEIPYGKTISYGKLAALLGNPRKIRAVANAIGKNPLPIIIPCHRVVGKNGELTGYLGGLRRKKQLLELEGFKQLQLF